MLHLWWRWESIIWEDYKSAITTTALKFLSNYNKSTYIGNWADSRGDKRMHNLQNIERVLLKSNSKVE